MKNCIVVLFVLFLLISGCSKISKFTDTIANTSARERYKRDAQKLLLYTQWEKAYAASLSDSLEVALPYTEFGTFVPSRLAVYSYNVSLKEGEVLKVKVYRDSLHHKVFIDLFDTVGTRHVAAQRQEDRDFEYVVELTGTYKLIIQPELAATSRFAISVAKEPLYGFPVSGIGNDAIQSFWGFDRDGGTRKHEGVDIFAKRGTPVIAVADGYVTNTGERGIGGKQVWMRTGDFGSSVYYAHLDSIIATSGRQVQKGDTLGLVGSTGNAKGGPPHLHFGIYKNGAVDPLPFIYAIKAPQAPNLKEFANAFRSDALQIKGQSANLRQGPSTASSVVGNLTRGQVVEYLGEHKDWVHIKTETGQRAFLHKSLVSAVNLNN